MVMGVWDGDDGNGNGVLSMVMVEKVMMVGLVMVTDVVYQTGNGEGVSDDEIVVMMVMLVEYLEGGYEDDGVSYEVVMVMSWCCQAFQAVWFDDGDDDKDGGSVRNWIGDDGGDGDTGVRCIGSGDAGGCVMEVMMLRSGGDARGNVMVVVVSVVMMMIK